MDRTVTQGVSVREKRRAELNTHVGQKVLGGEEHRYRL